jgi:uncharacterized repeat protein (TIGR02543 family)
MLTDFFKLPGTATVTLNSDLDAGYIQINTLDLVPETPGITNPESWQGTYLRSVPIKVTAHPKPGYEFVGWEGSRTSTETQLEIMLTSDLELTAVFRKL